MHEIIPLAQSSARENFFQKKHPRACIYQKKTLPLHPKLELFLNL